MTCTFDYFYTNVRELHAIGERRRQSGKVNISAIAVEGQKAVPTKRFWKSFFVRFGISESVFRYFEPAEVFERIIRQLQTIEARGPGRLVANKEWTRLNAER